MYSIARTKFKGISRHGLPPKFIGAITLFLATFFSTYFLEPFEIHPPEHTVHYFWICFFRAGLAACLALIYLTFIQPKATWPLHKKLFHVALFLLLFGGINFLIRDVIYDNPDNWSWHFLFTELRNTFLLGLFILWLMLSLNYNLLFGDEKENAMVSENLPMDDLGMKKQAAVSIITQVKADDFLLPLDHFILAKSEGNYTEIFTIENQRVHKRLKRIPLKSLEEQLSPYPWLVRTHRSYLINQQLVDNMTGNAQGYQLSLKYYPEKVPVSRAFIPHFNKANALVSS